MSDLFFDARSAAAWLANAVGRSIGQLFIQFVSTTSNGLGMQPSHHRDSSETTMSQLQGFTSRHPTSLLFVQTIQQSVQLSMFLHLRRIMSAATNRTPTIVTWLPCHRFPPDLAENRILNHHPQFTKLILDRCLATQRKEGHSAGFARNPPKNMNRRATGAAEIQLKFAHDAQFHS